MKPVFLVGYMGSGKSTIGKLVAQNMGWDFIDMDHYIEKDQQKTISQIFAEQGEDAFRLLERECLHQTALLNNTIVATGGGAPCFFENTDFMNEAGITIYLKLSVEELAERLEIIGFSKRPLLAGKSSLELRSFIADALAIRAPYYEKAQFHVSGSISQTVIDVSKIINSAPGGQFINPGHKKIIS